MVVILAVLVFLRKAPLALGSRVLSWGLIFGEVLVSQTLSIAIAIAVGVAVGNLLNWRALTFTSKSIAVSAALAIGLVTLGGAATGTRFDLSDRISSASAQYRLDEAVIVQSVLEGGPVVSLIGTGPGSLITVTNLYSHLDEVKRDTHNVYNNVALKTGIVGLVLFILPAFLALRRLAKSQAPTGRALAGALSAVCFVSITVPFLWTAAGVAALLLLLYLAETFDARIDCPHEGDFRE